MFCVFAGYVPKFEKSSDRLTLPPDAKKVILQGIYTLKTLEH
jgi:hypothetical protein